MKKILSLFTALILFGSMTVKADYYVAGTMNGWNAGDNNYKMSGSDPYSVTKQLNSGDYQFKITQGSWSWSSNSYDQSASNVELSIKDGNIAFSLSTNSDVTFSYNASTGKAYVQATPVVVPSYTFPAGTTIYYDFRTYGAGVNLFNSLWNNEWKSDVSSIISCTLTSNWEVTASSNLFKSAASSWNIVTCSTLPTEGQNMLVSTDGSTFHWDTYSGAPIEPDAFVAGSEAEIFGTTWDASAAANQMTWDEGLSKYKKEYTVDKAYKSVALKVVYDNQWYGVEGGDNNVKFSLSGAGTFTVLFDKTTHYVTLDGAIVGDEQFDFGYVAVAGNGTSGNSWLNGANWDATAAANRMTEVSTNVYEISFNDVEGTECQFQFTFDGGWDYQFGGTFSSFGTATTAVYGDGGGNIVFTPTEGADITIRLDLSGFNFVTKEGATFTVSQVAPAPVVTVEAKGEWDGWTDALAFVPDGSGLTATATLSDLPAGNYAFKLIVNDNWLSNENAFHRFWTSASGITENLDNMELQADADGDYVFTWTFATNAIAITFPETPKTGNNEVKFFPPRTEEHPWNEVYVYAWRRTGGENEQLTGDWPGIPATKDGEWYKATIAKGACVVFNDNNNGMQSFDIENVQKDVCYIANEIVDGDPIKAKFYESCTVNYFLTSGDEAIMGAGNAWKADLAERQLDGSNEITLTALPAGIYEFKLTNGSWAWSLGGQEHLNSACSSAAVTSGNGNVKFKIESAQDVTISYNPATQKICLSAETVLPFEDVRTGLTDGNYYTVCFNREMKQIRGASLWSFIGRDAEFAYIVQESAPFAAGKPYVLFAESEKLEAILDREVSAPVANGALHGTFSLLDQADLDEKKTEAGDKDVYLVIGNELRRATGTGTGGNSLPAYRAYVIVGEIDLISTPSPAPGKKVRSMPMQKDQAQGFENLQTSDKPVKVVIDGALYILRGENVYDATGRMVK